MINKYDLLIIIVKKGNSKIVIDVAMKQGAQGSTVINGRGSSVHETNKILGISIEPEKEIVLIVVNKNKTDIILDMINKEAELEKPGRGIGFALDVEKVVGFNEIVEI